MSACESAKTISPWPALRLQQLVDACTSMFLSEPDENTRKRKQITLVESLLWWWGIDRYYWELYRDSPMEFSFHYSMEKSLSTLSIVCDGVHQSRYLQRAPPLRQSSVEKLILSTRSYGLLCRTKKLQLYSCVGSFACIGLSANRIFRGRFGAAGLFAVAAADLQTISFNCYDRRYAELYHHQITGDLNKTLDTVHQTFKSLIGVSEYSSNPFHRITNKINWEVLLTGTNSMLAINLVN